MEPKVRSPSQFQTDKEINKYNINSKKRSYYEKDIYINNGYWFSCLISI